MFRPLVNAIADLAKAVRGMAGLQEGGVTRELKLIRERVTEMELNVMSKITDWAAQQEADLGEIRSTLEAISTGIVNLDDQITKLQNSPGQVTPEDQAALDRIQAASKALVNKAKDIRVNAEDGQPGSQPQPQLGPDGQPLPPQPSAPGQPGFTRSA